MSEYAFFDVVGFRVFGFKKKMLVMYFQIWEFAMNKKQLVSLWCGIGAVVLGFLTAYTEIYAEEYGSVVALFILWVFVVAIVTGGLILTFEVNKNR